jgi:outer membrane protein assembly factor BamB
MSRFIGENGFYPKWTQGVGRWVHQKVPVQTGAMPLIFPHEASQYLVWVPPKRGAFGLRKVSLQDEISNSIRELNIIPFICTTCGWRGTGQELGYAGEQSYYALKCPECFGFESLEPDLRGLDENSIIERWVKLDKPVLEAPGAARNIVSIRPIADLKHWIRSFVPMPNELAYVGQQLWPNFATFITEAQRLDRYNDQNRQTFNKEVQGTIFFGAEDNKLYAVDASTGQLRWNYGAGGAIVSSPVAAYNTVYFGSWDKKLRALNVLTGELKWSYHTEGEINSTPVVIHGKVCFGSWDKRLYALDAISGELRWACKTGGRILCSPAATSSMVYFGSEDGKWYAVDLESGNMKWSHSRDLMGAEDKEFGYRCMGVANGLVYFIGSDEKLYALNSESGRLIWTFYDEKRYAEDSLGGIEHVSIQQEGLLLCSGIYIGFYLLDGKTGELLTSRKELYEFGPAITGPASIADAVVYAFAFADEMIIAFEAMTGKVIWRSSKDVTRADFVPTAIGRIICIAQGKELIALDAMTGDYRWSYHGDEEITTSPTVLLYDALLDVSRRAPGSPAA